MLHLLLTACYCVDGGYFLAGKALPPDEGWLVKMVRLGALRYIGESTPARGCLSDGTGTLHRLFSVA